MANNERIYQIKLNGITESVDLVDKLLKRLEDLEKRINNLQGKNVSVGTSGGGGSSKSGGADLYDKIEKTQQRINQASDEEYKILLKKKAELKEIEKEQKAIVAGERAEQQEYANTLNGQRQKLADMKAALGNITIDSPDFEKQVQEIDALNNKIKEIEQSYGQYGRNVGNYANGVAEGLQKVVIKVGDGERTFNSAREALRTLGNELKSMAVNGEQNTQAYSDLDEAFKKLQSTMKDVSASSTMMDNLLDTMQGLTAIGSIGQGFAALFGIDDSEIQKSIQKLVALQNVLQGLETLSKQLKTGEGFMGWFSKGNELIEKFSQNLMGVKTTATATATELEGVATAEKSVATSSTIAARGAKLLAGALKSIIIIGAGVALGKWLQSLTSQFSDVEKAANDVRDKMSVAYNSAKRELESYNKILQNFVGTKKDEEAIVNQLNSKYGSAMGTYKTIAQWKDVLVKKTEAYCEAMRLEAEMAAATKDVEDAYLNLQRAKRGELTTWQSIKSVIFGSEDYKKENIENAQKNVDAAIKWADNTREKLQNLYQKAGLFDYSPQIKSASAKVGETVRQQEEEITRLRIRAMDEGLQKVIAEINYNARKEIDALKLTGARKTEAIELIEKERQRKVREAEAKDYRERIEARRNFIKEILNLENENASANIEYIEKAQNAAIEAVQNGLKVLDSNGFLRFLYFDEEHRNRKQEFAIDFNLALTGDERAKRLLEDIPNQEAYWREKLKLNPDDYSPAVMMSKLVVNTEDSVKEMIKQIDSAVDDYLRKIKVVRSSFSGKDEELEKFISDSSKEVTEQIEKIANQYGFTIYGSLRDFQYKTLTDLYNDSLDLQKTYSAEIARTQIENINTLYTERIEEIKRLAELQREELEDEIRKTFGSLKIGSEIIEFSDKDISKAKELAKNYGGELGAAFASGKISIEEFSKYFDKFIEKYTKSRNLIDEKEKLDIINTEQIDKVKELSNVYVGEIDRVVQTIEKQISATQTKYSTQIQTETRDVFGILDLSQTKKITNQTIQAYQTLSTQLEEQLNILKIKFENNQISVEDYNKELQKIIPLWNKIQEELKKVPANAPDFTDFLSSIMPYVSQLANGLQNILGQVSNLISAEFDAQRQMLEDELQILEENYNAQEELEQRHADKINAIEDEIANARGARRDYLVSLYNAEIEAQRKAYQEKLKIDAEMKRKEEEQKALERAERKRQNQIQFSQALMSQSLAILNAFATKPWQVGLAMGALATALTGVQIALMKKAQQASEKYGNGGIVSGNSHAQGGVKAVVGGQRAIELEGNEFIIRKKTATQNLPLLDYINKSERKLDANDLLEFFKGNQGTKTIRNSFKNKYASGGILPAVSATKTSNVIVVKDSSNPVVSVVDIINATDNYNQVRVLAGVEE